ncbi:MAG: nitrous oxide reductase family maturation protein NosD [Promethearchaeota archaeon]
MRCSLKRISYLLMLGIIFTLFFTNIVNPNTLHLLAWGAKDETLNNEQKCAGFWIINHVYINENDPLNNWATIEATYPWCSGSGDHDDPYIIEDVFINGGGEGICIHIMNSNVYFEIQNCTLTNASYGIKLDYTTKGYIYSNKLKNNNASGVGLFNSNENFIHSNSFYDNSIDGIYLSESERNVITHNNISFNDYYGIRLHVSNENAVVNNTIVYSELGIEIYGDENEIIYNFIYNNTGTGIKLMEANQNRIAANFFYHNLNSGLDFYQSDTNRITSNIINNNSQGIVLYDSDSNILTCNNITKNRFYGVYLDNLTNDNSVSLNNFIENCLAPSSLANSQAYDWDKDSENMFSQNYWDDWNGNGGYGIDGPSGTFTNEDSDPLDSPTDIYDCPPLGDVVIGLSGTIFLLILCIAFASLVVCAKKRKFIELRFES